VSRPTRAEPGERELIRHLREQRWFGAKSREIAGARIVDHASLGSSPETVEELVEVRYTAGDHEIFQLVTRESGSAEPRDALSHPAFVGRLFELIAERGSVDAAEGLLEFCRPERSRVAGTDAEVRALGLEQSNSSVVVGDELIVKAYRRLEAGVNPELEMLRFLGEHGFEHVPPLEGWWTYSGPVTNASLGVVQGFVPGAVDGWTLALDELRHRPEELVDRVRRLGTVIGELHCVLSSDATDPAFAPEEVSTESLALLVATVDDEIEGVFAALPTTDEVAPIAGQGDAVRELLRELSSVGGVGRRIRNHGDLHLGQALWSDGDWAVVDFEGEPARALPERRQKSSPLRDVAGMLRSFAYASRVAGVAETPVEERMRAVFLEAYLETMGRTALLPQPETAARLLRIFELEKAVYELRYELAHRPDWVSIPVAGIAQLLE
jgi:maltokinase